jgi:hypothetical protein
VVDEVEERVVGPVQVLEDDDERAVLGELLEEAPPRCERLAPLGRDVGCEAEQRTEVPAHPVVGDGRLELRLDLLRRVALGDAGLGLDHLAERPERDPVAVGEAAPVPPADQLRVLLDAPEELEDEAALADPGHADDRHELRRALLPGAREGPGEQVDLALPADEPRLVHPLDRHARTRLESLPDRDRLGLPLCLDRLALLVHDRVPRRVVGPPADEDAVHGRRRLEPGRRVDHVARRHRLARRGVRARLTSASPVAIPIRSSMPSSCANSRIARAARTARSGSSS